MAKKPTALTFRDIVLGAEADVIRAALDALSDYGRPARIELAVLVDRGHREMPISADYVGIALDTHRLDHVKVSLEETDGHEQVRVIQKDSP